MTAEIPQMVFAVGAVCIALIGFTGVVAALANRGANTWTIEEAFRIRTMIEPASTGLFGSFVPPTLVGFGWPPARLWKASNAVYLAFCIVALIAYLARARRSTPVRSQIFMSIFSVLMMAALAFGASGILARPDLVFLIALWMPMLVATHNFGLMVYTITDPLAPDGLESEMARSGSVEAAQASEIPEA